MTTLPTTVPANAQQAGLWFIHESDPECSAYHLALAAEVTAEPALGARVLDILSDLLAEHEALRAGLRAGPEGPEQFVAEDLAPLVHHTDCRATDPAALRTLIRDDSRVPFDLSRPPLWRVHLYRTGESTWVFAVVMHHIAADFWSLALLLTEVRARLDGTPSPFTLDGGAFAAYAARQRESLAGPRAAALLQDEAKRLADPRPGSTCTATCRARPSRPTTAAPSPSRSRPPRRRRCGGSRARRRRPRTPSCSPRTSSS